MKRGKAPSICLLLLCCYAASTTNCIVTDQIEFEQDRNSPPTVLKINPGQEIQTVKFSPVVHIFELWVWDPDITELGNIGAQYVIKRESNEEDIGVCSMPAAENFDHEEGIDLSLLNSGTLAKVTCSIKGNTIVGTAPVDSMIAVKVEISDLGFYSLQPLQNAHTVSAVWQFRVIE